ncbi:MAG: DNA cytosine methyltransferase [Phaeodactylibacter sp.]|uniref:DNA cytosine methyltransferase n=1 Tax=Phaeodactylibacter sp. TaxID=1940289 RepID=UPI0032F06D26
MGNRLTSLEICAGAGGQAIGLEAAGFDHLALVEVDHHACNTLRFNRPSWNVIEMDVRKFDGKPYEGVDFFAGGVPCPPFSVAGKQLGWDDERDLFPDALRLVEETRPKAVMIENVKGLMSKKFANYRKQILRKLKELGYFGDWKLIYAADFGVPQLRPRAILVALQEAYWPYFDWPCVKPGERLTVGEALYDQMAANGWEGAEAWSGKANSIAPTLVGGSKKHGGADLGPTRAKKAWLELGVNGKSLANEAPMPDFEGIPRLTVQMTATVQGFPKDWVFTGKKTASYRQIGNAFPPPVAKGVGRAIASALRKEKLFDKPGIVLELAFSETTKR